MKKKLASISENHPLEYFTDEINIPNQKLINEIIKYFEIGEGSRVFGPLEILNLLELQISFIKLNIQDGPKVISSLLNLPLNKLENHVFLGLILKWFGGYPVSNMNDDFDTTLKLIQKEFLNFDVDTPEKKFCRADEEERKKFLRLEIALNASLKHGINATEILEKLEKDENVKLYGQFDEMFYDFVKNEKILQFANNQDYLFAQSIYHYEFKTWLFDKKELEYGNEQQFRNLLSIKLFGEFLDSKNKMNKELERESILGSSFRKKQYYEAYPDLTSQINLFQREFEKYKFPFKNIFESNDSLKNKLFDEFSIAPLKPSFITFLRQFYSVDEYDSAIAEYHKRVGTTKSNQLVAANFYAVSDFEKDVFRIQDEFNDLCKTDDLHGKFYCPDLSLTELVKNCSYLDQRLEVLKKSIFDPATDKYKEVEIEANNMKILLDKFSPDIRGYIKSAIISDNENIFIYIRSIGKGSTDKNLVDKWTDIKGKLNGVLEHRVKLLNNDEKVKSGYRKTVKDSLPQILEDIFIDTSNSEKCLAILRNLESPVINESNIYIGKLKGIFPLWIKLLKSNKPSPLIDHFPDIVYKDLLNAKIKNLYLSKDASEFRKNYKRLENSGVESEIKFHLSQLSQNGNLGK
ncbi:hypothetical protein [Taibaiella koreensis]|uniref:hypothetical protein n=1 Tax=Taibaiella koreensis TaxID=1268548 RepID=UPI000E59C651|nr:hypothetical protein [Taibaiella koreensis]